MLICAILPAFAYCQTHKCIKLSFDNEAFEIVEDSGLARIIVKEQGFYFHDDTSQPALPFKIVNVLIPATSNYKTFTFTKTEHLIGNIQLAPNPKSVPTNYRGEYIQPTIMHYANDEYPSQPIEYVGTREYDGYKYLSFKVSPFKYYARDKRLYLTENYDLDIVLNDNKETSKHGNALIPISFLKSRRFISSLVVNGDEIELMYPLQRSSSPYIENGTDSCRYLIITSQALASSFSDLVEWKRQRGIWTEILTTEYIYSHYTGSTNQRKIKQAIKDYYDNRHVKYVLLGGDANVIPVFYYPLVIGSHSRCLPADLYYSSFADMDWNLVNGNPQSLFPNLSIARIPMSTTTEITKFCQRIKKYEKATNSSNWNNNLLMGGRVVACQSGGISDARNKGGIIYSQYIQPYWNGTRDELFDSLFTVNNLKNRLSMGYSFVNIETHGNNNHWLLHNGYYFNTDAMTLSNPNPTIITTSACLTNNFDSCANCLSKAFLTAINSNIPAYWGCSREGWGQASMTSLHTSDNFIANFYKYLFTENNTSFGEIVRKTRQQLESQTSVDTYRWVFLGMNAMGDPEMPIYTNIPTTLTVSRTYTDGILTVITSQTGCKVCVMSVGDNGLSFYEVQEDIDGTVNNFTFQPTCNECTICVTKRGFVPKLLTVTNTTYIQNQTFTGTNLLTNVGNLYAGSNVTSTKPQGPVIIQSGTTTIDNPTSVTLSAGFEVKIGAVFQITTQ